MHLWHGESFPGQPCSRNGPQRFEATAPDYVPKADLRVLFIAD
jgi:hypothetical protein